MPRNRRAAWHVLEDEEAGNNDAIQEQYEGGDNFRRHQRGGNPDPNPIEEVLQLHSGDHPGMQLVSAQLTGTNFLNWSRSIKRALGARSKLELLDGSLAGPAVTSSYYKAWIKVDYMISSWIINSISNELVNAFIHIDSTKKLWDALNQRFGRSNGPKIARLQREIGSYTQGNQTVLVYFNSLTALWNELDMLLPPFNCVCGAKNVAMEREENQRLMQFLNGLNDSYENARNQVLFLDPLPNVDRAYSMILQVED